MNAFFANETNYTTVYTEEPLSIVVILDSKLYKNINKVVIYSSWS